MSILRKMSLFLILGMLVVLAPSIGNAEEQDDFEVESEIASIRIPLVQTAETSVDSHQKSSIATISNVGYVDFWLTTSPYKLNYAVTVNPPYRGNGFSGSINVTNMDSGLSHGSYSISGMNGSITPPSYKNRYSATLSGALLDNGKPTGVTLYSKAIVWRVN